MIKNTIGDALHSLRPTSSFIIDFNSGEITWDEANTETVPTFDEIEEELTRLDQVEVANEYARNRKAKYDALNQLELISDDAINGTTTHKDAILAIKAEFPKPQ